MRALLSRVSGIGFSRAMSRAIPHFSHIIAYPSTSSQTIINPASPSHIHGRNIRRKCIQAKYDGRKLKRNTVGETRRKMVGETRRNLGRIPIGEIRRKRKAPTNVRARTARRLDVILLSLFPRATRYTQHRWKRERRPLSHRDRA